MYVVCACVCVCICVCVCVCCDVQEQRDRLEQAEQVEQQVQHRKCIEELFQLWDSHLAGFIDLNDFVNTLIKWKGFENQEALNQGYLQGNH